MPWPPDFLRMHSMTFKIFHCGSLGKTARLFWSLAAAIIIACLALAEAAETSPKWLGGADAARQRLQPVTLTWDGVAIRDGLADLAQAERVAIVLDRRIDPGLLVSLSARRKPLDELVAGAARQLGGGASWLGPLAYVGPTEAASRLRTLAALRTADVLTLPKAKRTAFQRQAAMSWEMLAEPRRLVADLAVEAGVAIEPLDMIDHDLWPTANLPPLSWTDRLTLLLNEFDLTFEFAGNDRLRLTPIKGPVALERSYSRGKQADEIAERWRTLAPEAQIDVSSGKITVRGRLEDHELFAAKKPVEATPPAAGVEVFTLKIDATPLSAVLDHLRKQLSTEIRVDEAALMKANLSIDRMVSFSVKQVSFDELLKAALEPAGLDFVRQGDVYVVVPSSSPKR